MCLYNGREYTLGALTKKLSRIGIENPGKIAKNYIKPLDAK